EREVDVEAGDADQDDLAALAGDVDRLLDRRPEADDLEGDVGTPAGQAEDPQSGIDLVGLDRVGRPELAGHLQLRLEHVDGDDLGGTGDAGALDDVEADAAAADDDDVVA